MCNSDHLFHVQNLCLEGLFLSKAKKITSMILAIVMLLSVAPASVLASAALVNDSSQYTYGDVTGAPVNWSTDTSATTEVIRVAYGANSYSLGTQIVAATPSGIPINTNNAPYNSVALGGETAANAKIVFSVTGIMPTSVSVQATAGVSDINISATPSQVTQNGTTTYTWEVINGQATAGNDVVYTISYVYEGKTYKDYAFARVEDILIQTGYAVHYTKRNWIGQSKTRIGFVAQLAGKNVYTDTLSNYSMETDEVGYINYAQTNALSDKKLMGLGSEEYFDDSVNAYGTQSIKGAIPGTKKGVMIKSQGAATQSRFNVAYGANGNRGDAHIYIDRRNEDLGSLNFRATAQISEKDKMGQFKFEAIRWYNNQTFELGEETSILDTTATWTNSNEVSFTFNTSWISELGASQTTKFNGTGPMPAAGVDDGYFPYSLSIQGNADDDTYSAGMVDVHFHVYDTSDLYNVFRGVMLGGNFSYPCTTNAYKGNTLTFGLAGAPQESWFTSGTWTRFAAAYQAAGKLLANPRADQASINAAALELWTAYTELAYKNAQVSVNVKHVLASDNTTEIIPTQIETFARGQRVTAKAATIGGFEVSSLAVQSVYADGSNPEETIVFTYTPKDVPVYAFTNNDNADMNDYAVPYGSTFNVSTATADIGTKAGYEFSGNWYYDSEFTQPVTSFTMGVQAVSIFAKWVPAAVNVYLNTQISGQARIKLDNNQYRPEPGAPVSFPRPASDPNVPGYIFVDYYADAALTEQLEFPLSLSFGEGEREIYGRFVDVKNKIIFESNGGEAVPDMTYTVGETVTPPTTTKTGFDFAGWYLDRECTQPVDWSQATNDETGFVAYAGWANLSYQIRFDLNHLEYSNVDTTSIEPINGTVGSKVASDNVPPTPRRLGYVFEYWQLNGKKFDFATDNIPAMAYQMDGDTRYVTATAIWRSTPYSAVIELDSYEKLLGSLTPTDDTPTQRGDIVTVRMTATTNFHTGSSLFVFMYDQTLFELVGTGAGAFTLNEDNDYISGINAKYTAVTNSASMPWPTGLDSTKYAAMQIAIDPTVALDNYNTEPMADGTWLLEFQLKVKDTAESKEYKNAVYMSEEWIRNADNPTGTMFFGWSKESGSVLDTYNNVVTPDLTTAYVDITISDEAVQQTTVKLDAGEGAVFANNSQTAEFTGREATEIEGYVRPTKTGYSLVNWTNKDAASSYQVWDEGYYPAAANDGDEFLANWKADEFTVTYYTEVGGDVVYTTQTVAYETNITGPNTAPTKQGYVFDGWVDADGQAVTLPVACPLGDTELYATWAPGPSTFKVRVTYLNNATGVQTTPNPTTFDGTTGYTVVLDYAANIPATPAANTIYLTIENDLPVVAAGKYKFDDSTYAGPITGVIAADGSLILDVRYKGIPITFTFDAGEGKFSNGQSTFTEVGEFATTANGPEEDPVREGWDFGGWKNFETEAQKRMNNDKTITAIWNAKKTHVRFMLDESTQYGDLAEVAYGSAITAPATNPTKEGYEFVGWAEVPNSTEGTMSLGNADALDGAEGYAKTYYAAFKLATFTVTYTVDGTAVGEIESYTMGQDVTIRADVVQKGYNFSGWTIKGGDAVTAGQVITMPAANIVIEGTLSPKSIGVVFNAGEGKFADSANTATVETEFNSDIILPAEPTRTGYDFLGWIAAEGDVPSKDYLGVLTEEAAEFTAVWEAQDKNYSVYIYIMDTTGAYPAETAPSETKTFTGTVDQAVDTYVPAEKAGFAVDTAASVVDGVVPAEGELILKVYYTRNRYDIVYDIDGAKTTNTFYYQEAITPIADPEKTGYTFAAWSPAVPATMPIDGIEVAATWTTNKYKVTFYTDDTKAATHYSNDHEYLTAVPSVNNPAAREGYKFLGWAYEGTTDIVNLATITVPANDISFVGIWEVQSYKLVYRSRTGEFASYDVVYGTPKAEWPVPAGEPADYEGYYFTKWADVANATMPASQVVITAEWAIESYTFKFNTDGGNDIADITANFGATITVPADPTKTGYTFAGWNETIPTTMPDLGADGAEKTFTASWTINEYTITFNTDGGSAVPEIKQNYGTDITAPDAPTKTGYTFAGWDKEIPATMPAENMTITAKWTINQYKITFDTDGGTEIAPIEQNYNTAVIKPADPTKTGYTFAGWDKEIPSVMPNENITITAQWTVNQYKITFANTGDSAIAPIEQDYGTAITAPAAPTREGYTFTGWDKAVPATMPAENMTITAQWEINTYKITFENTGDTVIAPIEAAYGSVIDWPADPTKTGYTFTGWDKAKINTMPAENVTVTGSWSINQYTIKFVETDAYGTETAVVFEQKLDYNANIADIVPATASEREFYTFEGWALTANAPVEDVIVDFGTVPAENVTYYAVYARVPVTLTLVAGSTTVIDKDNAPDASLTGGEAITGYIYGLETKLTVDKLLAEYIKVEGDGRIEVTPTKFNRCGTGTKVEVIDNQTELVTETYFIIIFGDINGDSNVDATDYTALEKEVAPRNESVATNWSVAMNGEEVNANYDHCKVMAADLDADDKVDNDLVDGETSDLAVLNDVNFRRVVIDQTVGTTYIPE